ncbi:hypothetical protein MMC18_005282 [Xylographa bjoerkii]|nr:hypothetical protein [Xylographa bjoerkii]
MPTLKPKPSEIAAEAKRTYIPYIEQHYPQYPSKSFLHLDSSLMRLSPGKSSPQRRLRVAVINGDPIDVALDWHDYDRGTSAREGASSRHGQEATPIPVVNMANEKRPGGDWESGVLAPEENMCRRSNLVHCLNSTWTASLGSSNYPIPTTGGIYSPYVVVFRSGPDRGYELWQQCKCLPVISVAPIRRPKLDDSGKDYSFGEEKELMKENIRTVLRIAVAWNHQDLCVGAFGSGPVFRNPVQQLAIMWKDVLFSEAEFQGAFTNVVFAIENITTSPNLGQSSDYEVFKQEFNADNVFKTAYR